MEKKHSKMIRIRLPGEKKVTQDRKKKEKVLNY